MMASKGFSFVNPSSADACYVEQEQGHEQETNSQSPRCLGGFDHANRNLCEHWHCTLQEAPGNDQHSPASR